MTWRLSRQICPLNFPLSVRGGGRKTKTEEEIMYYDYGTFEVDPNASGTSLRVKFPKNAPSGIYEIGVHNGMRQGGLNVAFLNALNNEGTLLPTLKPLYASNLPVSYDSTEKITKTIRPLLDGGLVTYAVRTAPDTQTIQNGACAKGFAHHSKGLEEEAVFISASSGMSNYGYYIKQISN